MMSFAPGKRRIFLAIASIGVLIILLNLTWLSGVDVSSKIKDITIPGKSTEPAVSYLSFYTGVWHD
jgi:hypothetical protein